MDFSFKVNKLYEHAITGKTVTVTGKKNGDLGALISLEEDGKRLGSAWALPDTPARFETGQGELVAALGVNSRPLPFKLGLIDFRKRDYPGTQSAASYESDVALEDSVDKTFIKKTIWMNHPLDYKGYRIFQSSFSQNPDSGETSIFTIAKNPGIPFIYAGAIILFAGVACLFYVKPLSSFYPREKK